MAGAPQFTTVTTEGGLLPSDLISRLVNDTESLPGTRAEDYRLTPGRQLREIINRSWNDLLGAWQVFQPQIARLPPEDHTANLTWDRWLLPLFAELGYGRLERFPETLTIGDKDYPVSHHHEQTFVHLVGWNVRLDRRTAGVVGAARAAPHSMVQELLNRTDERLWAIVSNGRQLRLLRDNSSLTRAAYVEFDLEQMFSEGIFTDFVALWLLAHATRVEGDPQSGCWLEIWANEARQQGVRALDTLGEGFEEAIKTIGQGFLAHPANGTLRERLREGSLSRQDYYRELLRVVYRIVFLLVAEDRGLLHPPDVSAEAKERYARYFSLSRIRDLARRRRGTNHSDLWEQIANVARFIGSEGQPALGLPALNSGLWSTDGTADLESARLANTNLLTAVRSLAYTRQDQALHRIDYRNLGSEELGSVYESLLELQPELDPTTAAFSLGHAAGNERKTSGSYYTPTSLISSLLDSALNPVLNEAESKTDPEAALLKLRVLDPACGSGHFLVAAAQRIARRLAMLRTGETDPAPDVFRHALREVIGRCIFGIDLNPMAVELCKVSLWLESVEPGKPLSFLDHHVVCGNSLLGATPALLAAGIPDEAFKALEGDDKATVAALKKRNKQERAGQGTLVFGSTDDLLSAFGAEMQAIDGMPENTLSDIRAKERRWLTMQKSAEADRARLASDAWCAAFVSHKAKGLPAITEAFARQVAQHPERELDQNLLKEVVRLREQYRFLHLHLAFPDVFQPASTVEDDPELHIIGESGFDVVVGNPPWDQVIFQDREWFASRVPDIANVSTAAKRRRLVDRLAVEDRVMYDDFRQAEREVNATAHFLRASGRYALTGVGRHITTAAVFAEAMRSSLCPTGRAGMVAPTEVATGDTTRYFFEDLVNRGSLVSLYDFENSAGVFPAVHRSYKFCLLTMTGTARPTPKGAEFAFFAKDIADLAIDGRKFELSRGDFELLNPNTRTCPIFRSSRDAELTKSIYRRVPVLIQQRPTPQNAWGISTRPGLFNMALDSELFHTAQDVDELQRLQGATGFLPLYEAKMFHHFDHRWSHAESDAALDRTDPSAVVEPRYWVSTAEVERRVSDSPWFIAFRDITNATNERTVIACAIPLVAVGHTAPLCVTSAPWRTLLPAVLSSFIVDYVARQKVGGTHLNISYLEQLPVLPPSVFDKPAPWNSECTLGRWALHRSVELTYTAWDLQPYALEAGHEGPPFKWDGDRRSQLRAELDACFFHLYGIERDEVAYIMDTFPIVRRKDESAYGEYRTARLILERYDEMSKATESGVPYRGVLE